MRPALLALAMLLHLVGDADAGERELLAPLLTVSAREGRFVSPTPGEAVRLEEAFLAALVRSPEAVAWREHGFRLAQPAPGLYALGEEENRGRGFYLLRPGGKAVVLQAPHRFSDQLTGDIALDLFTRGAFLAGAWNTRHRRDQASGEDSDLAHVPHNPFTALALATARSGLPAVIVQLHGFERSKRATPAAAGADLIVSSGQRRPTPKAERLAACLSGVGVARLYPREAEELGGETNVTGKALRGMNFATLTRPEFIHIEMSAELRRRLLDDTTLMEKMAACLSPD